MSTREITLEGGSPWGFRIHGGADTHQPLRVSRVNPGSSAAQRGVREGDLISTINGQPTRHLTNSEAHHLLRTAGNTLVLGLNQESGSSPKRRTHRVQEHKEELIEKTTTTSNTYTSTTSRITTTSINNIENKHNNINNNCNTTTTNSKRTPESENPHDITSTQLENGYSTDSRGRVEKDNNEKKNLIEKSLTNATELHATMPGGVSRSRKRKIRSIRKKKHSVERENSNEQSVERADISDNVNFDKKCDIIDNSSRLGTQMSSNVTSTDEKQLVERQSQQNTNKQKSITEIIQENYNKSIKFKGKYNKNSASQQENSPSTSSSYQEKTNSSTKNTFQQAISIENLSSQRWTSISQSSSSEKRSDSLEMNCQSTETLQQDLITKSSIDILGFSSNTNESSKPNSQQNTTLQQSLTTESSIETLAPSSNNKESFNQNLSLKSCIPVKQSSKTRNRKKGSKKSNTNQSPQDENYSETHQELILQSAPQKQVPIDDESSLRSPRDVASQDNPFHKKESPIPYIDDIIIKTFSEINNNCNKQEETCLLETGSLKLTQVEVEQGEIEKTLVVESKMEETDRNGDQSVPKQDVTGKKSRTEEDNTERTVPEVQIAQKIDPSVLKQVDTSDKSITDRPMQAKTLQIDNQVDGSILKQVETGENPQKGAECAKVSTLGVTKEPEGYLKQLNTIGTKEKTVLNIQDLKHDLDQEHVSQCVRKDIKTAEESVSLEKSEAVISQEVEIELLGASESNLINISKVEEESSVRHKNPEIQEIKCSESGSSLDTTEAVISQEEQKISEPKTVEVGTSNLEVGEIECSESSSSLEPTKPVISLKENAKPKASESKEACEKVLKEANQNPLLEKIRSSNSFDEDKYIVESPKRTRIVNGQVVKSRSLDDDIIKITEVETDDELVSESEKCPESCKAIVSDAESDDMEWETTEDLRSYNQSLHYGKLSIISLPLVEHRIENVSNISPEEEKNLRSFLEALNLGTPEEYKKVEKGDSKAAKKAKKRAAIAQHFLPYFHNPRYLDAISEEGSDLSDNDLRKETMSTSRTRPLIINPYWHSGNPLEHLTLTNDAILVGTKMIESIEKQNPLQEASWSFVTEAHECSGQPEVVYLDDDSSESMTPSDLLELEEAQDADGEDEESEIERSLDECLELENNLQKKIINNLNESITNISNIHVFSVNCQEFANDYDYQNNSPDPKNDKKVDLPLLIEELPNISPTKNTPLEKEPSSKELDDTDNTSFIKNLENIIVETKNILTPQDDLPTLLVDLQKLNDSSQSCEMDQKKIIKNLEDIINEIENISTDSNKNETSKSITLSTSVKETSNITLPNENKKDFDKEVFLNKIVSTISLGDSDKLDKLINDSRFEITPVEIKEMVSTLKKYLSTTQEKSKSPEVLLGKHDNAFNKEFRLFCEVLKGDAEVSRPDSSNSERSSRSTSQCTAVYNPLHSSLTNIAALLKDDGTSNMEQPHSLKEICVQQLLKMPFGTEVIEELAKVSSNIEDMTNSMYYQPHQTNLSASNNIPTSEISHLTDPPKTKTDWVGMPLEENPSVLVCLSPAQKTYIETVRNTPKEADSLLDLHQKYIDRQFPQVSTPSQEDITITNLRVNGKNSHQKWKDFRSSSVGEVPTPFKRASSYIDYQNFMREYQRESQNPDDFDGSIKDDGNINYNNYIKKVTREVPIQVERQFHRPVNNLVNMDEEMETSTSKQRLNAKHVSEWLNLARKDLHRVRAPLMRYHSCDGLDTPDYRRRSLPYELYERQMQYILNKEREIQMEIHHLEEEKQKLELMEKSKSEGDLKHMREKKFFDASSYQISKKGDIAIHTDKSLPSETFRQKMFDEWVHKMAEREERKQHKVIKITSTTTTHQESSETVQIRHSFGIEDEFLEKVKKRNSKLGLEEEQDEKEEGSKKHDKDSSQIVDGVSTNLPKHLQEFVEYISKDDKHNDTKASENSSQNLREDIVNATEVKEALSKTKDQREEKPLLDSTKVTDNKTNLQEKDCKKQAKIILHPITIDKSFLNSKETKNSKEAKVVEPKINSKSYDQKLEEKSSEVQPSTSVPKEDYKKVIVHPIELLDKTLRNQSETKAQENLPNMEIKVIETKKIDEKTLFSKHFQDFVNYLNDRTDPGVWSPNKSTEIQQFKNDTVEKSTTITKDKEKDRGGGGEDKKNETIPTIWTPSSANASPVPERKEFRPIKFESPILGRKNRSKESTPVTTPDSVASVPPPWEQSQDHKNEQDRRPLSSSHSAPSAGLSSLAGTKLPKAQNPTITLLQKAREGQLPRGASYIEESTTTQQRRIKDDRLPLVGQHEVPVYVIKSEYMKETDSDKPKKMADLGPRKFEGIGPTTKDGMPIAIRSEVKEPNQHKWYKRMYDTLHKTKPDEDYVTVRYKTRRGRYPYTSAGGYLSEPEPNAYDSDASQTSTSKYATLDRRRLLVANDKENEYVTYTVPRSNRYMSASVRHTNEVYKNQPGRIENYVPGRSSISEKEAKEWWDEVMEIFDGHLEQQKHVPQKSFMSHALKESGYESDSQLVFRRREDGLMRLPDPVEQRQAYKEIQKGGEVPLHGLRKPAPERPKESPRRYVENEVTIHYRSPVRQEIKEIVSEEELARRQADAMRRIYQEERRRKYLQELQDMNSRRHGDNFTPSQKSPIPLNRYDNFLDEVGGPTVTSRVRVNSPEPRIIARALYNFVGQTSRELTFRKGDLIYIRRQVDKNWYEGEHNAMVGLFPANYIEIVPFDKSRPTVRKPHEGQARAKFNFIAQTPIELSLVKGELVVLTRRVDQNWFEGRIGGRVGIFPVSYVDILIDPQSSDQRIESTSSKPVASPASHSLVIQNGSSSGHHYQPGSYKGQSIDGSFHAKPAQVTNTLTRTQKTAINQMLHIDTHNDPVPYKAMYKYRPQNDDELELLEGDTVFVIEKCDDGWFVGSSQRTGAFGTFPGNYVERI